MSCSRSAGDPLPGFSLVRESDELVSDLYGRPSVGALFANESLTTEGPPNEGRAYRFIIVSGGPL